MTIGDDGHRHTDWLIGIFIASPFTIVGAVSIEAEWQIMLAGIMAYVEASRVHDWESTPVGSRAP